MNIEKVRQTVKSIFEYLPQGLRLYRDLTARQFIDYLAILKGTDSPKQRKYPVQDALEKVSLMKCPVKPICFRSGI
jgi:ABC-type multidrug transport system ATPase subunit